MRTKRRSWPSLLVTMLPSKSPRFPPHTLHVPLTVLVPRTLGNGSKSVVAISPPRPASKLGRPRRKLRPGTSRRRPMIRPCSCRGSNKRPRSCANNSRRSSRASNGNVSSKTRAMRCGMVTPALPCRRRMIQMMENPRRSPPSWISVTYLLHLGRQTRRSTANTTPPVERVARRASAVLFTTITCAPLLCGSVR